MLWDPRSTVKTSVLQALPLLPFLPLIYSCAIHLPGLHATRQRMAGWSVLVVPVVKYTWTHDAAGNEQAKQFKPLKNQVLIKYSSSSTAFHPQDDDPAPDPPSSTVSTDYLLLTLNLASFNLSIRDRHDPYLMAQSLTRSSLWFGLPASELILFPMVLFVVGVLLMVAPGWECIKWWRLRERMKRDIMEDAADAEGGDDHPSSDEDIDLSGSDEDEHEPDDKSTSASGLAAIELTEIDRHPHRSVTPPSIHSNGHTLPHLNTASPTSQPSSSPQAPLSSTNSMKSLLSPAARVLRPPVPMKEASTTVPREPPTTSRAEVEGLEDIELELARALESPNH